MSVRNLGTLWKRAANPGQSAENQRHWYDYGCRLEGPSPAFGVHQPAQRQGADDQHGVARLDAVAHVVEPRTFSWRPSLVNPTQLS